MESLAKHQRVCDNCNTVLSENYASTDNGKDMVSLDLKVKEENSDYRYSQEHNFCNEACLASHLSDRAKGKGKKIAKASMIFAAASVTVDITASEGYKKPSAE